MSIDCSCDGMKFCEEPEFKCARCGRRYAYYACGPDDGDWEIIEGEEL